MTQESVPKRQLGAAGLNVSAIGFGCMGMSEFYGASDDESSLRVLNHAADIGITLFDTADTYGNGHNELLLGRLLKERSGEVMVASKCGIVREPGRYERRLDTNPGYIRQACEASLSRLGVQRIDLYYLHRLSPAVPVEESVGALSDLIAEGKIGGYGLCEVSTTTLGRAHAVAAVTAVQSEYSLWSREPEQGLLQSCEELGVTFVAYSPLGRGFLTGAIAKTDILAQDDFRRSNPRFQPEALASNIRLLDGLGQIAGNHGCAKGQVALSWLLGKSSRVVPIPGTRRIACLDENAAAASIQLHQSEATLLDELFIPEAISGARYSQEGMKGLNA